MVNTEQRYYHDGHWSTVKDAAKSLQEYEILLQHPYQVLRNQMILNRLLPMSLKGMKVLDYGCGNGFMAVHAASRGAIVTGVDLSAEAVQAARMRADNQGVSANCTFLHTPNVMEFLNQCKQEYDFLILKDIIEHVPEDEMLVAGFAQLLRNGGKALVTTPNCISIGHAIDVAYFRYYKGKTNFVGGGDETHVRLYSSSQLKDLFTRHGFKREKLIAIGILPSDVLGWFKVEHTIKQFLSIDAAIGAIIPFNMLGTGQLNLFSLKSKASPSS